MLTWISLAAFGAFASLLVLLWRRRSDVGSERFERWRDRFLDLPGDSGSDAPAQVKALYRLLFIAISFELALESPNPLSYRLDSIQQALPPLIAIGCTIVFWRRPASSLPFVILALVLWARVARHFPASANHHYLQALIFSVGAMLRSQRDLASARLLEQTLRWLVVIPLVFSGVQKIAHGQYFDGQFFGYMVSQRDYFATPFQFLIPADELARIQSLSTTEGAGPFRVDSLLFVAGSNLAYILEVVLGLGLLVPRLRRVSALCTVAMMFVIEAAARELFFGAFMVAMLLVFTRRGVLEKSLPVFIVFYLFLFSMVAGILPRWHFY